MTLELAQRIDIEHGASMAAAKLESDPEAVAYLAETLAYYLPPAARSELARLIVEIDTLTRH